MFGRNTFYFGDNICVGVKDVDRAVAWYQEKLGLRLSPVRSEEYNTLLVFDKQDETGLALVAIPNGETEANVEAHPILFTKRIEAAHKDFSAKGIAVGPLQEDSGGNRFFRFRDLEDNEIEVCVEP